MRSLCAACAQLVRSLCSVLTSPACARPRFGRSCTRRSAPPTRRRWTTASPSSASAPRTARTTGWSVTLGAPRGASMDMRAVRRRRIELCEPEQPCACQLARSGAAVPRLCCLGGRARPCHERVARGRRVMRLYLAVRARAARAILCPPPLWTDLSPNARSLVLCSRQSSAARTHAASPTPPRTLWVCRPRGVSQTRRRLQACRRSHGLRREEWSEAPMASAEDCRNAQHQQDPGTSRLPTSAVRAHASELHGAFGIGDRAHGAA